MQHWKIRLHFKKKWPSRVRVNIMLRTKRPDGRYLTICHPCICLLISLKCILFLCPTFTRLSLLSFIWITFSWPHWRRDFLTWRPLIIFCLNSMSVPVMSWIHSFCQYRKTSSISRTKFQNLNVSCPLLHLQLSLPNPLKPGVKLRMKM